MKIIISFTAISLFLFSCGNTSNEKSKVQTETVIHEEHHHNDEIQTIELNNNEKWKVDDHMVAHIRNMENDINSFAMAEQKKYKLLSEKLLNNIDLLTSNCTMTGQAHDELHKWLLPYIEMVNELSESKDNMEAAKIFENIKASFATFNHYFY